VEPVIRAGAAPQGFQEIGLRSFDQKKPFAASIRLLSQCALGGRGCRLAIGCANKMDSRDAILLYDFFHAVHEGVGKQDSVFDPTNLDRFNPRAFAKSKRSNDFTDRPRCIAEFLDDVLGPFGGGVETRAVPRRLKRLRGLCLVEIEVFRMAFQRDVTSAS